MAQWYYSPHVGGKKIPPSEQDKIRKMASIFAASRPWSTHSSLVLRFKGQFCYLDTLKSGEEYTAQLCRLRYLSDNSWSLALYTYSNEKYQACVFPEGRHTGTLEAAILLCEDFIF